MVTISREWWEHLAPKALHRRLPEIERLLREWCRSEYGALWLRTAQEEGGRLRVRSGQFIPVFHAVALKGQPAFVGPQEKLREGHRTVGRDPDAWRSGRALEPGELPLRPEIRIEVVEDDALLRSASLTAHQHVFGVKEPALVFTIPATFLIAPSAWLKKSFVLYQHIFGGSASWPNDGWFYVGVTTRSWQKRWVSTAGRWRPRAPCCSTASSGRRCRPDG